MTEDPQWPQRPLDVWEVSTFDAELLTLLEAEADLVRDYFDTERQLFLSHDRDRSLSRAGLRPENPNARGFLDLKETIGREMEKRTIRAFHYTRLTDGEVAALRREGIQLSTPESLQQRFDRVVADGGLSRDVADQLYAASPFHSDQLDSRTGRFWMASHPIAVDDSGVTPLTKHWGGEVASMWVRDGALTAPLASLGVPRIIEVAVPMKATSHSYRAAEAVVATFARSRGSVPDKSAFDISVEHPLPPTAILAVHSSLWDGTIRWRPPNKGGWRSPQCDAGASRGSRAGVPLATCGAVRVRQGDVLCLPHGAVAVSPRRRALHDYDHSAESVRAHACGR